MKTYMKSMQAVMFLLVLLVLMNCKKNADPVPTPNDLIVGTWNISTVSLAITVGGKSLVDYLKSQGLSDADAQAVAAQITDSIKGDNSGKVEIKKGGDYTSTDSSGATTSGKWELTADGKTLTLDKGTANAAVYNVTTLTSSKMNISADLTETDNGVTYKIHIEIAMTK